MCLNRSHTRSGLFIGESNTESLLCLLGTSVLSLLTTKSKGHVIFRGRFHEGKRRTLGSHSRGPLVILRLFLCFLYVYQYKEE